MSRKKESAQPLRPVLDGGGAGLYLAYCARPAGGFDIEVEPVSDAAEEAVKQGLELPDGVATVGN